jgi:antitoxin component YwqK of YwqJK toxin-antitoxin module
MLLLLHNNLLIYILNQYLDYYLDMIKLQQLFDIKFPFKPHLNISIEIHGNYKFIYINVDNKTKILQKYIITPKYKDCRTYFDIYGYIIKQILYNKNSFISHINYRNEDGQIIRTDTYYLGFPNKLYKIQHFVNILEEGITTFYKPNGKMIFKYNYIKGKKSGLQTAYDNNENISKQWIE